MRQLTIKLIDNSISQEYEVTTSLDHLRYLDGAFVVTPELTFQTSVVTLASTNLHSEAVGALVEVKASLCISFADFAKLIINKSLTTTLNRSLFDDVKTSILQTSSSDDVLTDNMIYDTLIGAGNYSFEFTLS